LELETVWVLPPEDFKTIFFFAKTLLLEANIIPAVSKIKQNTFTIYMLYFFYKGMSKKILIPASLILLAGLAGGGYYFFQIRTQNLTPQAIDLPTPTPTEEIKEIVFKVYEDEAGFTFSYPESLIVTEKDLDESDVYSSLELTSFDYPDEKIIVKIADTTQKSTDKWLKAEIDETQISTSEAKLASLAGVKVNYPQSLVFLALDSSISFFVQSPKSNVFWTNSFEKILETFTLELAPKNTTTTGSSTSGSEIIDEGEEIVQ